MSKTFIIPTKPDNSKEAEESLRELIEDYKEEIVFDDDEFAYMYLQDENKKEDHN